MKFAGAKLTEACATIRKHLLVPKTIPVYGYIFDVKTGRFPEFDSAKALGAAGK
jgi:carbonic anhydrase